MASHSFALEVDVDLNLEEDGAPETLTLEVTGRYYPGFSGTMYRSNGDPGDPPEPAEVDMHSITLPTAVGRIDIWPLLLRYHPIMLDTIEARVWEALEDANDHPEEEPDDYLPNPRDFEGDCL